MQAAFIGVPQSGKSTLFSAVTGVHVDPHAPPEPRHAVVHVPDSRLQYLADLCHPKKVTEATIEFVDVPGCSLDDAKGQHEWRRLLPAVRQADLLVVVVRDFVNDAVPAFRNRIDPKADFDAVWEELVFADLESVTSRIAKLEAALKKPTKTHDPEKRELALMERCRQVVESEEALSSVITTEEDRRLVSSFAFLTEKPLLVVRNITEPGGIRQADPGQVASGLAPGAEQEAWSVPHAKEVLTLSAAIEAEIAALEPQERPAFLADLGLEQDARSRFIPACYRAAGLISFLTMNPEEVRAWSVPQGTTAVEAAAKVHTDFARGFIRAETISFDELVACKDLKTARATGRLRKEGKSYVVSDGEILHILAST